jgi:hypothetical protein
MYSLFNQLTIQLFDDLTKKPFYPLSQTAAGGERFDRLRRNYSSVIGINRKSQGSAMVTNGNSMRLKCAHDLSFSAMTCPPGTMSERFLM